MTVSRFTRTETTEVTYVRGGDVQELAAALKEFGEEFGSLEGQTWRTEDGAVVFEVPLDSVMVGGDEKLAEKAEVGISAPAWRAAAPIADSDDASL
ncbi:MAG: hypothetical protein CMH36_10040 [Microbacterium sp.]|uniref:Uncharacterized protein n=1 Tax=Microbacterium ginsengisoli TaxID=400772 RepID=A0A3C1KHT4_9MICO|nr:hypothetical protein [Microbacterium sp. 4NA327F11]MAL07149.1 hypothetical protein [Microbacterium sp.]MCK9917244.1 hypothetical protein [Microbacteriaceae bacterium K1510]HAN25816.1 hypothetical protein [Microbacterium ginsengisoli]